jgi:hypothetical protein
LPSAVKPTGFGGSATTLPSSRPAYQAGVLGEELLHHVKPHREYHQIGGLDRLVDGGGPSRGTQFAREHCCIGLVPRGQRYVLTAAD